MTKELLEDGWVHNPSEGLIAYLGGLWIRERADGHDFAFLADERHANRNGVVHGGMLMTFVDRAFGMSARMAAGAKRGATVSISHQFMMPMEIGQVATVTPRIVKLTRRMAFVEGTVFHETDPVMQAHGVWRLKNGDE